MKLLTKGELTIPGDCGVCHATENREWFLDTGVYLDYIGAFYVCNMCMIDFIHAAGGLTKDELAILLEQQAEEIHFKNAEIDEVSRLSYNVAALLPLTFKEILEHFDDRSGTDIVPSEPEPDAYAEPHSPDGSNEPPDTDDVELKFITDERPTLSW